MNPDEPCWHWRTPMDEYLDARIAEAEQRHGLQYIARERFMREAMAGIREIPTTPHPKGLE